MKKILLTAMSLAVLFLAMSACNNGDYSANPNSNGNGSINPLKPLDSLAFTQWPSSTFKFSVKINGNVWQTDTAYWVLDTSGANRVTAIKDGMVLFEFYLKDTYGGIIYNMGFHQYNTACSYYANTAGATSIAYNLYQSVLGNSGELQMIVNDSSTFMGKFYFQGVNVKGDINNFTEGYFNLPKY